MASVEKQKNLTPTQHKLNPRMCTVRQSLTRLKIPQSHKSKIKAGGSTQAARGNLSFKFQQIPKNNRLNSNEFQLLVAGENWGQRSDAGFIVAATLLLKLK